MAGGTVEFAFPWGGDLQQLPNGDLAVVQDAYDNPAATIQRLEVLIMTNPTLRNEQTGQPIGRADDIFNDSYGSGARALVGELITDDVIAGIQARVAKAVSGDPGVAKIPAPIIDVQDLGNGKISLTISGQTTSGQPFTTPAWRLSPIGG